MAKDYRQKESEEIRQDFIEGVDEVFTTLFNVADETEDGILYYPYIESDLNVYGEDTVKEFLPPVNLVAKVELLPEDGGIEVEGQKETATFTIPVSSLMERDIDYSNQNLPNLRKGYIFFDGTFYEILRIKPRAFVENIFLLYEFNCKEDLEMKEIDIG